MTTEGDNFGTADVWIREVVSDLIDQFAGEVREACGDARIRKGLCDGAREVSSGWIMVSKGECATV
jgi:hypothetical protein